MLLKVDLLEKSFDLLAPDGDRRTDIFYSRLFVAAPAVRPLFADTDLAMLEAAAAAELELAACELARR